ncbi:MAG: histidine kinase [Bryobacteraceae bacterium]
MTREAVINAAGHAAGVLLFAHMLYLIVRTGASPEIRRLPALSAGIALLWNLLSLIALGFTESGSATHRFLAASSFSALSLLPAVLLAMSLPAATFRTTVRAGYVLSAIAVVAHWAELTFEPAPLHRAGLAAITIGFGLLTARAVLQLLWREPNPSRAALPRLLATMSLFLFAISFVHFGDGHTHQAWSEELLIHHAGIPLALFLLLQDWRFLMVDAFVRLVVNVLLALMMAVGVWWLAGGGEAVVLVLAMSLGFAAFAGMRPVLQRALTRLLFRQPPPELIAPAMRAARESSADESQYWQRSLETIATLMKADAIGWRSEPANGEPPVAPAMASELSTPLAQGAAVVIPVRLAAGEARWGLLGERRGRQPYLSEDLALLARLAGQIAEDVEQIRQIEARRLISEAEFRALQAQLHPHFLFNALNALYGAIPKEAAPARRMLLSLSDVFRYFLRAGRDMVTVEEEMQVVRSYLAIESARLGARLQVEVEAAAAAMRERIPVLTVQPLVENAIKHGVAANPKGGWLRIDVWRDNGHLHVRVSDSGCGPGATARAPGMGVGLENVQRRLHLCFGSRASFHRSFGESGSTVGFAIHVEPDKSTSNCEKEDAAASTYC